MPRRSLWICCAALLLAACGGSKPPLLADLAGREKFSMFQLATLRGTRDGDRLDVNGLITDTSSILTLDMRFAVGTPATLATGTWQWTRNSVRTTGTVAGRSVQFLGGQSGPPSIGGVFDLLGPDAKPLYRVTIPVTVLKQPDGRR